MGNAQHKAEDAFPELHRFCKHSLTLIDKDDMVRHFCRGCEEWFVGPSYSCRDCVYYLHKSCGELPREKQHFFHPSCNLTLTASSSLIFCNACCQLRSGFTYHCSNCNFNMDVSCASIPTLVSEDGEQDIQHFSHGHPLTLVVKTEDDEAHYCQICGQLCTAAGPIYGCSRCNLNFHKTCLAILPQNFQHFFHGCRLTLRTTQSYQCCACQKTRIAGLCFHCSKCDFHLDVDCALKAIIKSDEDHRQIQHISHGHPLSLLENTEGNELAYCAACPRKLCSPGPNYCCNQCNFWLHKSCVELPQKIEHYFHPCPCSLFLKEEVSSFHCDVCNKIRSGFRFCCGPCGFNVDVECSLYPIISEIPQHIMHFSHGHPLILYDKMNISNEGCCCKICRKTCFGPTYACNICNFFFHKSCAQVKEIHHLSHPSCPLSLMYKSRKFLYKQHEAPDPKHRLPRWRHKLWENNSCFIWKAQGLDYCSLCLKDCCGFIFRCDECDFQLDPGCASLISAVKYDGHEHLLIFLEKMGGETARGCSACNANFIDSPGFRCSSCKFSLHLLCGPLPCTIKHECYLLTLKDFYVEGQNDEEFYCDACEKRRDVRHCVYVCTDTPFVSHVDCMLSEAMAALKGERGDVALRTVGRQIKGQVIGKDLAVELMKQKIKIEPAALTLTFKDMINSLSRTEKREVETLSAAVTIKSSSHAFRQLKEIPGTKQRGSEDVALKLVKPKTKMTEWDIRTLRAAVIEIYSRKRRNMKRLLRLLDGLEGIPFSTDAFVQLRKILGEKQGRMEDLASELAKQRMKIGPAFMLKDVITSLIEIEEQREMERFHGLVHGLEGSPFSNDAFNHLREIPDEKQRGRECRQIHFDGLEGDPFTEDAFDQLEKLFDGLEGDQFTEDAFDQPEYLKRLFDGLEGNPFSKDAFDQLIERLDSNTALQSTPFFLKEHKNDFVDCGNYMVPRIFVPVMNDLFARYGDISEESVSSPRVKSLVFFVLCGVIHSMRMTLVLDITEDVLCQWWRCIKSVEIIGGFEIQFVKNHLNRVVEAHFGLQATKLEEEQAREIGRISEEIKQLKDQLETTKLQREHYIRYINTETPDIMKQCFSDALSMKWKPAADGLL